MIHHTLNLVFDTKIKSFAFPNAEVSFLYEVLLVLLQHVQHVLALEANLKPLLWSQMHVHNPNLGLASAN